MFSYSRYLYDIVYVVSSNKIIITVAVLKLVYSERYMNIPNGNRTRVSRLPVRLLYTRQ